VQLQGAFYGDGAMRQTSPLSPAIHLGASRLLIIGVNDPLPSAATAAPKPIEPTFGQMFGFMLDSLFMDALLTDLERIKLYNENEGMRQIESLLITPTRDVNEIARRHIGELPRSMRTLLRALGAHNSASTLLLSYLMFERGFTREMIDLGYEDARARAVEIRAFLRVGEARKYRSSRA
jgi:NTE family protein